MLTLCVILFFTSISKIGNDRSSSRTVLWGEISRLKATTFEIESGNGNTPRMGFNSVLEVTATPEASASGEIQNHTLK